MFFDELKRRRVPRVLAGYLVIAWAAIQVADTIAPRLGIADWVVTALIVVAAVGLPVALILAWFINLDSSGVRSLRVAGAVGVMLLAGVVVYAAVSGRRLSGSDTLDAVAVLPFANLSGDPAQEAFADGIAEEILNALTQVPELKVAARTSAFAFKNEKTDVREVARKLGVKAVLGGGVRKSGNQLRITAQLTDGRNGYNLWSQSFERSAGDVFAIQDEIARAIVAALRVRMTDGALPTVKRGGTSNLSAHELYLVGLSHFARRRPADLRRAIELFEQAIAADSTYALAWAGLAKVYAVAPFYLELPIEETARRGRAAATRALQLDPRNAEAHAALGDIAIHADYDFATAESHLKRAIALKPSYMQAWDWLAEVYVATDRMDEAIAAARRAVELDPIALRSNGLYAHILSVAGRYDESLAQFAKVFAIDSTFMTFRLSYASSLMALNRTSEAAASIRNSAQLEDEYSKELETIAGALENPDKRAAAVKALEAISTTPGATGAFAVMTLTRLGEHDKAIEALERQFEQRHAAFPFLMVDDRVAALRSYPRFQRLRAYPD